MWLISFESCISVFYQTSPTSMTHFVWVIEESRIHGSVHLSHRRAPHSWLISVESCQSVFYQKSPTSMTHFIWIMKEPLIRIHDSFYFSHERVPHAFFIRVMEEPPILDWLHLGPTSITHLIGTRLTQNVSWMWLMHQCLLSRRHWHWCMTQNTLMHDSKLIWVMHQCLLSSESYIHDSFRLSYRRVPHPWLRFIWAPHAWCILSAYAVGIMFGLQLTLRIRHPTSLPKSRCLLQNAF